MSREHLVTESFFEGESVEMFGFAWCKENPVRVGLGAATAKILCTKHNSDLSEIDKIGKKAFTALREIQRLNSIRKSLKPNWWSIRKYTVEGLAFERWCLKTLINLCCNLPYPIGCDSDVKSRPSERLVRIAYGLESFDGKAGLYSVARIGMNVLQEDKVGFMPLFRNGAKVAAGIFTFRGLTFLINLEVDEGTLVLKDVMIDGQSLAGAGLSYHVKRFNFNIGKYPSQQFVFDW